MASSFAHLLYPRKKPSNFISLGKKASKQFGAAAKPKKEPQAQISSSDPVIVEMSSPTRPALERASTYDAVLLQMGLYQTQSGGTSNSSRPRSSRPAAQRFRSAIEIKPSKSVQRLRFVQPQSLESSSEHGSSPPHRQRPQNSTSASHSNFSPKHIRDSTIEEDADHTSEYGSVRQPPRLVSPVQRPVTPLRTTDDSRPEPKRRSFLSRMLSRNASDSAVEQIKSGSPSLENSQLPYARSPGSMLTASSASSRRSYFPHLRQQSSDTSSQISPKTVKPERPLQGLGSSRTPSGLIDVKAWLDMNRDPAPSDIARRDKPQNNCVKRLSPAADSFLPSEMRRINTPPMQSAVATRKHRSMYRGFFFDHAAASQAGETEDMTTDSMPLIKPLMANPPLQGRGPYANERSRRFSNDFYRQRIDQVAAEPEVMEEKRPTRSFSIDVPDHLPGSPLCPLHPKHFGGQRAICPMHGRGRRGKGQVQSAQKSQESL